MDIVLLNSVSARSNYSSTVVVTVMEIMSSKVTIDGESFAGLNFRSFDPMKYFAEILSRFIGQECLCYIDNY